MCRIDGVSSGPRRRRDASEGPRWTPDRTGSNTGYSSGGMRYCPSWIAYECLRILSQMCFHRNPIASMTHLAVSSRGRSRNTAASGAGAGHALGRASGVGAVQTAKARAKAAPTASRGCGGRGAAGASRPAFTNAAMGRLWRSYSFQGSRFGVAIVRTSRGAPGAKLFVARRSRNCHESTCINRESTLWVRASLQLFFTRDASTKGRLRWQGFFVVRALGALFR